MSESTKLARPTPPFLYHCSPTKNRASIRAEGLRPGNPSNAFDWTPPHVCYAESALRARSLMHAEGCVDLWIVATRGYHFTLANEGVEWRSQQAIPAALVDDGSEVVRLTDLWIKTERARASLQARLEAWTNSEATR